MKCRAACLANSIMSTAPMAKLGATSTGRRRAVGLAARSRPGRRRSSPVVPTTTGTRCSRQVRTFARTDAGSGEIDHHVDIGLVQSASSRVGEVLAHAQQSRRRPPSKAGVDRSHQLQLRIVGPTAVAGGAPMRPSAPRHRHPDLGVALMSRAHPSRLRPGRPDNPPAPTLVELRPRRTPMPTTDSCAGR